MGSVISVDNVTANDAGEYRCEVMSEAGTINDSITIRGEGDRFGEENEVFIGARGDKVVVAYTPLSEQLRIQYAS